MVKLKLHLDADTSSKSLHSALVSKGHDVTRTPNDWMPLDASDETQLLRSTAQGRSIFTFNVRDFIVLAQQYPQHGGIILAAQNSWSLSDLIAALDRLLSEAEAVESICSRFARSFIICQLGNNGFALDPYYGGFQLGGAVH